MQWLPYPLIHPNSPAQQAINYTKRCARRLAVFMKSTAQRAFSMNPESSDEEGDGPQGHVPQDPASEPLLIDALDRLRISSNNDSPAPAPAAVSPVLTPMPSPASSSPSSTPLLPSPSAPPHPLAHIAKGIRNGAYTRIAVMCGAGISVSCGIPDFRSPKTGLYDNLAKYNLPTPQAIFSLDYFRKRPEPFFQLAKELFPEKYKPSPTHYFIRLLQDKGLLLHCFTQNIDGLEQRAGLLPSNFVQAHGVFGEQDECIDCHEQVSSAITRPLILADQIPKCPKCSGLLKPPITFFGEDLPPLYDARVSILKDADLLIIMGTSLVVHPFCYLVHEVWSHVPRVLLNRERVGEVDSAKLQQLRFERQSRMEVVDKRGGEAKEDAEFTRLEEEIAVESDKLDFEGAESVETMPRDVFYSCNLDDGVRELCKEIGGDWEDKLDALIRGEGGVCGATASNGD